MGITEIVLQVPKATTLLLFTLPFCILLTAAVKECGCFQEKKGKTRKEGKGRKKEENDKDIETECKKKKEGK